MKKTKTSLIPQETIEGKILLIRGENVLLDCDLAALYGVETRVLKQAVKRNTKRFPEDFMFILKNSEVDNLVSQNVIPSKSRLGGALPMVFTEQGVAMLSGILNSDKAIEVNIAIMRTFVQIRKLMNNNKILAKKITDMEKNYDEKFNVADCPKRVI